MNVSVDNKQSSFWMRSTIYSRNQRRLEKILAGKVSTKNRVSAKIAVPSDNSIAYEGFLGTGAEVSIEFPDDGTVIEGLGGNGKNTTIYHLSPMISLPVQATIGGAVGGALESLFGRSRNDVINRLTTQIVNSISTRASSHAAGSFSTLTSGSLLVMHNPISSHHPSYMSENTNIVIEKARIRSFSIESFSNVLVNERAFASMLSAGILFGFHAYYCQLLGVDKNRPRPLDGKYITASALTGITTATLFTPFESIRSKLLYTKASRLSGTLYESTARIPRELLLVIKRGGLSSLYNGFGQIYTREFVGNVAYFSTYSYVKMKLENQAVSKHNKFNPFHIAVAGGCAGFAYWSLVYPIDTLRAVVQVPPSSHWSYSRLVHGISPRCLYRGYASCVCRSIPANAILFLGYELTMKII